MRNDDIAGKYRNSTYRAESTAEPADTIQKPKRSKKKIVIAIVSIIVVIIVGAVVLENLGHNCLYCGKQVAFSGYYMEYDDNNTEIFICEDCYNLYNSNNSGESESYETFDSDVNTQDKTNPKQEQYEYIGETFSFYSTYDMNLNWADSDDGYHGYEWEEVDGNVEIEVEIYDALDGYNSSEFATLLQKNYNAAFEDDTTYDTEKGVLKNGLPMTAVWQKKAEHDYYLEINTYTDEYYYEFQIFSYDEMYLISLYESINNCVIN